MKHYLWFFFFSLWGINSVASPMDKNQASQAASDTQKTDPRLSVDVSQYRQDLDKFAQLQRQKKQLQDEQQLLQLIISEKSLIAQAGMHNRRDINHYFTGQTDNSIADLNGIKVLAIFKSGKSHYKARISIPDKGIHIFTVHDLLAKGIIIRAINSHRVIVNLPSHKQMTLLP